MKFGIVQEVMKVEERKAIRREMASRPQPIHHRSPKANKSKNQDIAYL